MIVFDLHCTFGHRFEGWFSSSADFTAQQQRGLLSCPHCGAGDIEKAPMAPAVPRKGSQQQTQQAVAHPHAAPENSGAPGQKPTPEMMEALVKMAELQAKALKDSRWVGDRMVDEARAMFYGECEAQAIHGQATIEEAKELHEEGIPIAPLLFPVAPPKAIN